MKAAFILILCYQIAIFSFLLEDTDVKETKIPFAAAAVDYWTTQLDIYLLLFYHYILQAYLWIH